MLARSCGIALGVLPRRSWRAPERPRQRWPPRASPCSGAAPGSNASLWVGAIAIAGHRVRATLAGHALGSLIAPRADDSAAARARLRAAAGRRTAVLLHWRAARSRRRWSSGGCRRCRRASPALSFQQINGCCRWWRTDPRPRGGRCTDLADLFRVLMRDNATSPVADEVHLCRSISTRRSCAGRAPHRDWN